MLQSGQWTANPDGSLSRVKKEAGIPLGLPSKERISELENMNRPLTEGERKEYTLHGFRPFSQRKHACSVLLRGPHLLGRLLMS